MKVQNLAVMSLELVQGEVVPIPSIDSLKNILKIPNIGWYELQETENLELDKKIYYLIFLIQNLCICSFIYV